MITLANIRKAGTLLSDEFIEILDEHYPDLMPDAGWNHDAIQQGIGRIQVVRTIKEWKRMLEYPEKYNENENIFDLYKQKELN